jgi:hypothetical protein
MGLMASNKTNEKLIGKRYNVEFFLNNGKVQTFSSILANIDNIHFWFEDDMGMCMVRQVDIRSLMVLGD